MLVIQSKSALVFNNLVYLSQPHSIISRPIPEKYEERIKYRYSMAHLLRRRRGFYFMIVSKGFHFGTSILVAKAILRCKAIQKNFSQEA